MSAKEAETARLAAVAEGLVVWVGPDRWIELPHSGFDPSVPGAHALAGGGVIEPKTIPGLLVVQFAYPLRDEWLTSLETCGFARVATFQQRAFLVQGGGLDALGACSVANRIAWAEPWLASDRVAADLFEGDRPLGYVLQFLPGTDLAAKAEHWQSAGSWSNARTSEFGFPLAEVQTTPAVLRQIVTDDSDLLSVVPRGKGDFSDERQGQIVAGNHNGASVTTPGYRPWLMARELETTTNPQVVAIHDSGFDNDEVFAGPHHPDLEFSARFVALKTQPPTLSDASDEIGHGTMVAGILAGNGAKTNEIDLQGFAYGTGICPACRVAATKFLNIDNLVDHEQAYGEDLALEAAIATNSWNLRQTVNSVARAVNSYDESAQFFDARVRDANSFNQGAQPMTIVFSAGNQAWDYSTSTIWRDTVSTPATAKNVISVGASANYRPSASQGPLVAFQQNTNNERPPDLDALHIARIGSFSGRGRYFSVFPGPAMAHTTRIKPDLVAPGVRVFSTVPFDFDALTEYVSTVACTQYFPAPPVGYHSYGTGTSFAAPVVAGVAALGRKWFMDRGADPSPSLLKAALIATASDIGGVLGNDHRPSPNSGWGRVDLNRLTDGAARFYRKDNQILAVLTGQQRTWTLTVDNPALPVSAVLAWSDPPAELFGGSQAALVNNLGLLIEEVGTGAYFAGNNFHENRTGGVDDGYSQRFLADAKPPFVDAINNVEAIFIPADTFAAGQQLTLKVTGENVPGGAQKFAIYVYNLREP